MTTPSGQISLGSVNAEMAVGGQRSLGDATTRGLAGIPAGQISLSKLKDKSNAPPTPTEQIEWRYMIDTTNVEPDFLVSVYENSFTTKFTWNSTAINDGSLVTSGNPTGTRITGADGQVFEIGQFKENWYGLINQPTKVTNKMYEIGRVYLA